MSGMRLGSITPRLCPIRYNYGVKIGRTLRYVLIGVGVVLVGGLIYFAPIIKAVLKLGLPSGPEMRQYDGTSADNLKALRTALMLYHDNEDHFPEAAGWMDAIATQVRTNDLAPAEAAKKFHRPGLPPDQFGYALNDKAGGKYKGDLKDPKTPLLFESKDGQRNAHGDPSSSKGAQAITIDGILVRL